MANILDIRRRIRSVRNTRQITKAMKMVSAAKLRRAQERALAARPYAQMLTSVLQSLAERVEPFDPLTGELRHPLLAEREEKTALVAVVTGDKGLAGAFNTNISKAFLRTAELKTGRNIDVAVIGRKGRDFLRRRFPGGQPGSERKGSIQVTDEQVGIFGKLEFALARDWAGKLIERYALGEVDSVYLLFNEFKSVISQRVLVEQVLPIHSIGERDITSAEMPEVEARRETALAAARSGVSLREADTGEIDRQAAEFGRRNVEYIYEQPADRLFADLLPRYLAVQIYRALLESVAAEHAARMTAMESATNNASEMIDALTLAMNRARQAKITKEIIEIVSGAAAQ